MGTRKWWQRTAAAVCAAGIALSMAMVGAGPANATVDQNLPSNNEPDFNPTINGKNATQVYSFTFQVVHNQPSLTVHGGSMNDGAWVNTWGRYPGNGTTYPWASILSPNQLWEFIPHTDNSGGTLTDGWGYLRNRQSGKCLELNLSGGGIDQWTCVPGATNELWRAPWNGALEVKYTGPQNASLSYPGTYKTYLGVNTANGCQGWTANGDGETLYLRETVSECTHITHRKENYRFATNAASVQSALPGFERDRDQTLYRCLDGYAFAAKLPPASSIAVDPSPYVDDSIGDVHTSADQFTVAAGQFEDWDGTGPFQNSNGTWGGEMLRMFYQFSSPPHTRIGQVYLTCVPRAT